MHNRAVGPTIATIAGLIPGSLYHVHNFHWVQMKGGEQEWVLTAHDANYSNDKTSLILTTLSSRWFRRMESRLR